MSFDPILIGLVRKVASAALAADIIGVQPMTGGAGMVFGLNTPWVVGCDCEMLGFYDNAVDFPQSHAVWKNRLALEVVEWASEYLVSPFHYSRVRIACHLDTQEEELVWRWTFVDPDEAFAFKMRWG